MNRPSTPPVQHPVRLRLVKEHRLVVSIDDPAINRVDVTPGQAGPALSNLKAHVVGMDDELQTQLTQSGVKVLQPLFSESPPSSPPLDYSDLGSYEASYADKYNRYPSSIPSSLEPRTMPMVPMSPSRSKPSEVRVDDTIGSQADIEFKAGLYAHISEFCAARRYPVAVRIILYL